MAQIKCFSLGSIGSPCCCGGSCSTTICVGACGSNLPGIMGWIYSGSTLIANGSTTAGCVTLTIPSAGTYDVQYQIPGGSVVDSGSHALTCGGTLSLSASPSRGGYICCGNCPIPTTLTATDPNTTFALVYGSTAGVPPIGYSFPAQCGLTAGVPYFWGGSYQVSVAGVVVFSCDPITGACISSGESTQDITVYTNLCCNSLGPGHPALFTITRFWQTSSPFEGVCYYIPATLPPCAPINPSYTACGPFVKTQGGTSSSLSPSTCSSFVLSASVDLSSWSACSSGSGATDPAAGTIAISA